MDELDINKELTKKVVDDILEIIKQTRLTDKVFTTYDHDRMEFCRSKIMENVNGYRKSI